MTGILAFAGAIVSAEVQAGEAWQPRIGQPVWVAAEADGTKLGKVLELGIEGARVFRSVPFSGIVIVPPKGVDKTMVHSPDESVHYSMRVVAPELKLISQVARR